MTIEEVLKEHSYLDDHQIDIINRYCMRLSPGKLMFPSILKAKGMSESISFYAMEILQEHNKVEILYDPMCPNCLRSLGDEYCHHLVEIPDDLECDNCNNIGSSFRIVFRIK